MLIHGISLWETMKRALLALVFLLCIISYASAKDVHVRGYMRKDGRYVQPHHRSAPDGNPYNNWSTKGNVNPYTGKIGTKNIDPGYQQTPSPQGYNVQLPHYLSYQTPLRDGQDHSEQEHLSGSITPETAVLKENAMADMKLPYCKSFSATPIVKNSNGSIKRCECNGKVVFTNHFCQCHPCMNKEYSE